MNTIRRAIQQRCNEALQTQSHSVVYVGIDTQPTSPETLPASRQHPGLFLQMFSMKLMLAGDTQLGKAQGSSTSAGSGCYA